MCETTYHLAKSKEDRQVVYSFVYDCLLQEGYIRPLREGIFVQHSKLDASDYSSIIMAIRHRKIIGTATFIKDSPLGLPEEKDFKECVGAIRKEKRVVASIGRTFTSPSVRSQYMIIYQIFRELCILMKDSGVSTLVCAVNPKYEKAYQRILQMQSIGQCERMHDSHIQAGAVLMRLDWENLPTRFKNPGPSLIQPICFKERRFT